MSRDRVACVTSNPSAASSSRSRSWLATRSRRTILRMAAWRWVFMAPNLPLAANFGPRLVHDAAGDDGRSEEHTSELQSRLHLVCRLLLEKKKHPRSPTACPELPRRPEIPH